MPACLIIYLFIIYFLFYVCYHEAVLLINCWESLKPRQLLTPALVLAIILLKLKNKNDI